MALSFVNMQSLTYKETNYFSPLLCDYLSKDVRLESLYHRFPSFEHIEQQIKDKQNAFPEHHRAVLHEVLEQQYASLEHTSKSLANIKSIIDDNTFTVCTGHQLNLFTGPLYFLYKIISTINLCEALSNKYPNNNFVPVYWMATEDHDFEEINYFNFKGESIAWQRDFGGAVGELSTEGLGDVFTQFSEKVGLGKNATYLRDLFESAYLKHDNLALATQYLAHELFGDYGLVCIDANTANLKQLFAPYMKEELLLQTTYKSVKSTIQSFPEQYKIQVSPREINLFYITKGIRERIVYKNNKFQVLNTTISWRKEEILKCLKESPESFSPNVLLRPLYQEVILPNLCYVGGGGELAYWLELKKMFQNFKVTFPMLLPRNSALIVAEEVQGKIKKMGLSIPDLFLKQADLQKAYVLKQSKLKIDFTAQKEYLKTQFKDLYLLAEKTDKSFVGAVAAQEKKQLNGLIHLEKRLLKAEKRRFSEDLSKVKTYQDQLFPKQQLQERTVNFSELYLEYGPELIPMLKKALEPLTLRFTIL